MKTVCVSGQMPYGFGLTHKLFSLSNAENILSKTKQKRE
jgi:hypothetical protein